MARQAAADVVVVGAGVIGLSTAVCLAERGQTVEVRARLAPVQTTSAVASEASAFTAAALLLDG